METLLVYADFDWMASPTLVGELGYESLRGSDSYSFSFDKRWLDRYIHISLSNDLNNYPGKQYTEPGCDIFGCFSDALPDRWGRTLVNRREQLIAEQEHRRVRRLSSFDYLIGIDDFSRMGGLRFKKEPAGAFINSTAQLRIPPLSDIRSLLRASLEIEKGETEDDEVELRWISQLIHPGTSLGGARPKANVLDEAGHLCVAKFPSRKDEYDVALWEHLSHILARKAGIDAAETHLVPCPDNRHTLLSKRFDRTEAQKRIHFASSLTMLGLPDGSNASDGHGYLDIVDFIVQGCAAVEQNLRELYRRVAFNICIGNSDDHFRNHGFLLTPKGWTLSPAYDMNPTHNGHQSLLISASSNTSDLNTLLDACEDYMIGREDAQMIISEVVDAVASWEQSARILGMPKGEMSRFGYRLSSAHPPHGTSV